MNYIINEEKKQKYNECNISHYTESSDGKEDEPSSNNDKSS